MICYHHIDMDGKSAGYLVHKMKPTEIEDSPSSYFMTNYGDKMDKHTQKDDVFIVDISISKDTYPMLLEVCRTARTVTWIDHHATSVDVINNHFDELQHIPNLTYFVSTCACGAALTYAYFNIPQKDLMEIRKIGEDEVYSIDASYKANSHQCLGVINVLIKKSNTKDPTDVIWHDYNVMLPKWLFHVDDYDCWKKINSKTDCFILGTEAVNTALTIRDHKVFNPFWDRMSTDEKVCDNFIRNGTTISSYISSRYSRELRNTFEWTYNGVTFLCKNGTGNSWNFGERIKWYPAVILFNYDGKAGKWVYSVYSDDNSPFNCREFCETFEGGGGHPHAAGFSTKELIFTSKNFQNAKKNVIFLGGTCNNSSWREKFIDVWKKSNDSVTEEVELYNPVVADWTDECKKKEDEVKASARLNLFVITPEMSGCYSIAEAVECSHSSKVFFAIYDSTDSFSIADMKSFDAIGDIITKNGGTYKVYKNYMSNNHDKIEELVEDVIAFV